MRGEITIFLFAKAVFCPKCLSKRLLKNLIRNQKAGNKLLVLKVMRLLIPYF